MATVKISVRVTGWLVLGLNGCLVFRSTAQTEDFMTIDRYTDHILYIA